MSVGSIKGARRRLKALTKKGHLPRPAKKDDGTKIPRKPKN